MTPPPARARARRTSGHVSLTPSVLQVLVRGEAFRGFGVDFELQDPLLRKHARGRVVQDALSCSQLSLDVQRALCKVELS